MLNLPAVLDPVQVVERRGLRIEKAFAYDKDEISLPQDLVNLGVLEDKARFGKDTGFVLKTRFIVFSIAVVLVEVVRRPVLRDFLSQAAEHNVVKVTFHEEFIGIGFIEVCNFRSAIDLSPPARIWNAALPLYILPLFATLSA